jgi:hypothetical protein
VIKLSEADDLFDQMVSPKKEAKKVEPKPEPVKEAPKEMAKTEVKAEANLFDEPVEDVAPPKPQPQPIPQPEPVKPVPSAPAGDFFDENSTEKPCPPAPTPSPSRRAMVEDKFTFEEEAPSGKIVYTIYGMKGNGKTYLAFTFPGSKCCLSFDHKSAIVKATSFKDDQVKVYDAVRHMSEATPLEFLESSEKTFKFVLELLDFIKKENKPDWIILDGLEIMQQVAEMVMRARNNIGPYQGIANKNIWKERRIYLRQIHRKALDAAKLGVIYTTYTDKDEIVESGDFVTKKDVPKWIDAVMYETDVVIRVDHTQDKSGKKFTATIDSDKYNPELTGKSLDITGKGYAAIEAMKVKR